MKELCKNIVEELEMACCEILVPQKHIYWLQSHQMFNRIVFTMRLSGAMCILEGESKILSYILKP